MEEKVKNVSSNAYEPEAGGKVLVVDTRLFFNVPVLLENETFKMPYGFYNTDLALFAHDAKNKYGYKILFLVDDEEAEDYFHQELYSKVNMNFGLEQRGEESVIDQYELLDSYITEKQFKEHPETDVMLLISDRIVMSARPCVMRHEDFEGPLSFSQFFDAFCEAEDLMDFFQKTDLMVVFEAGNDITKSKTMLISPCLPPSGLDFEDIEETNIKEAFGF